MQSFKFLRYALHGDLVEDRRRERGGGGGGGENNAYFNGHFAVCTAMLGPKVYGLEERIQMCKEEGKIIPKIGATTLLIQYPRAAYAVHWDQFE